jgi:hypothetical protein
LGVALTNIEGTWRNGMRAITPICLPIRNATGRGAGSERRFVQKAGLHQMGILMRIAAIALVALAATGLSWAGDVQRVGRGMNRPGFPGGIRF